jgi:hypothetical protein
MKKHHDDHGKDASRPMKGNGPAVPNTHWEMRYSMNEPSPSMAATRGSDFNPKQSDKRQTTQRKVNREDH